MGGEEEEMEEAGEEVKNDRVARALRQSFRVAGALRQRMSSSAQALRQSIDNENAHTVEGKEEKQQEGKEGAVKEHMEREQEEMIGVGRGVDSRDAEAWTTLNPIESQ